MKLLRAATLAAGLLLPAAAVTGVVGSAQAQSSDTDKAAAKQAYKKGTTKYNLGEWEAAIVHFKAAFEAYPDASFLFNIAQSYRQAGDCKQSGFFYKRYLAIKPDASNKREVEGFINELKTDCANRPPPPPLDDPKDDGDTGTGNTGTGNTNSGDTGDGTEVAEVGGGSTEGEVTGKTGGSVTLGEEPAGPELLTAYASLGSSFMAVGDLDISPQLNFTVGGGYPIKMGSIDLDAGVLVSHTGVKWNVAGGPSGTAGFTAVLVNVGAGMEVASKIRLRAEVGAGAMVYSGLGVIGNIFVDPGTMATGALSGASFRAALGGEYALTDSIAVSVQPVVVNSSPAPSGLATGIEKINSFQALVGVGYKM